MSFYLNLLLCLVGVEILRRCCRALLIAFTGPLSKVPGPMVMKFSTLPVQLNAARGIQMYKLPQFFAEYGDTVRLGPKMVGVIGKSAAQKILVEDDMIKSPTYELFRTDPHVIDIFTVRDKVAHKHRRRLLSPAFSISYLNGLEPLMQGCIRMFEEVLDSSCLQGHGPVIVDMNNMMANLTADVMSETSFGGSFQLTKTNDKFLKEVFNTRLKRTMMYGQFPFLRHLPFLAPAEPPEIGELISNVIAKRRAVEKGQTKRDLLQLMLETSDENRATYSEKSLLEDLRVFMLAGSETSSVSLTFTILLLLNNPQKLKNLIEELDAALPSRNDPITFEGTKDLPYLNAVINESMRVMPSIPAGPTRVTLEDTVVNDYEIPAGTFLTVFSPGLAHDPRIWPDPDSFIPERWIHAYKGVEADRKASLPFSLGTRNCIGMQFAMREIRLILATLFRRYELSIVPGQSHEQRLFFTARLVSGRYLVGVKQRS